MECKGDMYTRSPHHLASLLHLLESADCGCPHFVDSSVTSSNSCMNLPANQYCAAPNGKRTFSPTLTIQVRHCTVCSETSRVRRCKRRDVRHNSEGTNLDCRNMWDHRGNVSQTLTLHAFSARKTSHTRSRCSLAVASCSSDTAA